MRLPLLALLLTTTASATPLRYTAFPLDLAPPPSNAYSDLTVPVAITDAGQVLFRNNHFTYHDDNLWISTGWSLSDPFTHSIINLYPESESPSYSIATLNSDNTLLIAAYNQPTSTVYTQSVTAPYSLTPIPSVVMPIGPIALNRNHHLLADAYNWTDNDHITSQPVLIINGLPTPLAPPRSVFDPYYLPGDVLLYALNDADQVVGVVYDANTHATPFLYQAGTFTTLPTPPCLEAFAYGILSDGTIYGYLNYDGQGHSQSCLWRNNILTLLPILPGYDANQLLAFNDSGDYLINFTNLTNESLNTPPLLYHDGEYLDPISLTDNAPATLGIADWILSPNGSLVASTYDGLTAHYYLLQPTNVPSPLLLTHRPSILLILRRRSHKHRPVCGRLVHPSLFS